MFQISSRSAGAPQASSAMRMNMAGAPVGGAVPPSKVTGVVAWKPMVP
jgi:hypothetical protein